MEAVREKRPKPKPRGLKENALGPAPEPPVLADFRVAPKVPERPPVAKQKSNGGNATNTNGIEHEEQEKLSDEEKIEDIGEEPSTSTVQRDEPHEIPAVPESVPPREKTPSPSIETPPEVPPRSLTLPRREAPPLPQRPPAAVYPSLAGAVEDEADGSREKCPLPAAPPAFERAVSQQLPPSYSEVHAHQVPRVNSVAMAPSTSLATVLADAPPMYPSLSSVVWEQTEHGLLTEHQLLTFYHNAHYEAIDDLVDSFVKIETSPHGPLYELLVRLKEVCARMAVTDAAEKQSGESLARCLRECWIVQEKTVSYQGKCGEDRDATGHGRYTQATLVQEKLQEMKRLLESNRTTLLDGRLCNEITFRSIALQIQWLLIGYNNAFMLENRLTVQSSPMLLENAVPSPSRSALRSALSDLFHFLRFPSPPKRFSEAVIIWIQEICCVLYKWISVADAQFLLLHLLRLPSPISDWAPALLQSLLTCAAPAKLRIDHSLTLLAHLLQPIKSRDEFLARIGSAEREDSTWAILGDDEEETEFSFVTVNESDLIALLDQLSVSDFYSVAYLHFTSQGADKSSQFLSLIAYQLLLMKVQNDGLNAYRQPIYKRFCKQIAMSMRQSVRELCAHWKLTKTMLNGDEEKLLQREVDRILLLAIQYIVSKDISGLWQFVVDLPYEAVSENCRLRVEYLLRKRTPTTLQELYEEDIGELRRRLTNFRLAERLQQVGDIDAVYLLNSLAAIHSHSADDPTPFMREIIQLCFVEESTRDSFYKVGSEAVAVLLSKRPACLPTLLAIVDRSIDDLGEMAVEILSVSPLAACKLPESVVGSVLGKWLVTKPPDHVASRIARRVLMSLNWGFDANAQLYMDTRVHVACAETIVKGHQAHCKQSNGLISKSLAKAAKLALKIPDFENTFNTFCWETLIRLKLPLQHTTAVPQPDLASFFVYLAQSAITSADEFLRVGVGLLNELSAAGCTVPCVVIVSRLLHLHHREITKLAANIHFVDIFHRILNADASSYAEQLVTGPQPAQKPIVKLFCSAIAFYGKSHADVSFARAWVELLLATTPSRPVDTWTKEVASLHLLGAAVSLTVSRAPADVSTLAALIQNSYTQQLSTSKSSRGGLFSIFSSEPPPPPLLQHSYMNISPWATYVCLLVESLSFSTFMGFLFETLAKKDKLSLNDGLKKALSKSSIWLPAERLPHMRWAAFLCLQEVANHPVFPFALQQFATHVFHRHAFNGKSRLFGGRLISAEGDVAAQMGVLRKLLESRPQHEDPKGLSRAVAGWVFSDPRVYQDGFREFGRFDLDYLLQLLISGDRNMWLDFIDLAAIIAGQTESEKIYTLRCHESNAATLARPPSNPETLSPSRERISRALPLPALPTHPNLPQVPMMDFAQASNQTLLLNTSGPLIRQLSKSAGVYSDSAEALQATDSGYCALLPSLYTASNTSLAIPLRCGGAMTSKCSAPATATVQVTTSEFSTAVDAQMTTNRETRAQALTTLHARVLDAAAVQTASLEYIATRLVQLAVGVSAQHRQSLQPAARAFFYQITAALSAPDTAECLFPSAMSCYEHVLTTLGREFISGRPEEQSTIMTLALDGFVLHPVLVHLFTPDRVHPSELVGIYRILSEGTQKPEKANRALALLSRLNISGGQADDLPPEQFKSLMPLALNTLATQPDASHPLHMLAKAHLIHFIFHAFPRNLSEGLRLALEGCDARATPRGLLDEIAARLGGADFEQPKTEYPLNSLTANECASVLATQLATSRSRLSNLLFVWADYIDAITKFAQIFIFTIVRLNFRSDMGTGVVQQDLGETFARATALFSPLIVPVSPSIPPFGPAEEPQGRLAVQRFVQLLLALPHDKHLPEGEDNMPALLARFYVERMSPLAHGTAHYFSLVESELLRVRWQSWWPAARAVQGLDATLSSRHADCGPFFSALTVRIPWNDVLSRGVSASERPLYLGSLFSLLSKVVARGSNFIKCRASLTELLKSLCQFPDWTLVPKEQLAATATFLIENFPFDALTNPSDVIGLYLAIWRKACGFSARDLGSGSTAVEALNRLALCLRTELRLLLRAPAEQVLPVYNALLASTNAIAVQQKELRPFLVVSQELTAVFSSITEQTLGETLVKGLNAYLRSNFGSPLVLTTLATVIRSLNPEQLSTGLKLIDKTIDAYFQRPVSNWSEVYEWVNFPEASHAAIRQYLFSVPNSSNKVTPLFLSLAAFSEQSKCTGCSEIQAFIIGLKPKYVEVEAESAYLLLIIRFLIAIVNTYYEGDSTSNDQLAAIERWAQTQQEDKSSFFSNVLGGRRGAFSNRFRLCLALLSLYIAQQWPSPDRKPRLSTSDGVLNAKILAVKELEGQKQYREHTRAIQLALPFFKQADKYHLRHVSDMLAKMGAELFRERYFSSL